MIGLPLGIWAARSDRAWSIIRPLLDGMQTIPAFVYLVPVVMLFGIGNVPGVIVTVIFAILPVVGSGLVWGPGAASLAMEGRWGSAIGLVIWGILG